MWRSRWASLGACVVVAVFGGGLFPSDAAGPESSFVAVAPTRVLDTRVNLGLAGKFVSETARLLTVTGLIPTAGGNAIVVPTGATAVAMNVTIVLPSNDGFASVRPGDAVGAPTTSNLNFGSGGAIPNAVTVALPPAGNLNLYYFGNGGGTTDMLIDIVGYYVAGGSGPPGAAGEDGPDGSRGPGLGREVIFSVSPPQSSIADSGTNPAIAIGVDGLPIIAYTDLTNNVLVVSHCVDVACSATNLPFAADTGEVAGDDVGFEPSIAIGSDGFAVVAHRDDTNDNLRVTHCSNVLCTSATSFTVDGAVDVGFDPAIAIGTDGLPIIAYYELTNTALKVTKCANVECTSVTTTYVDSDNDVGRNPSIAIGTDGLAIVAHTDLSSNQLRVTHCDNAACTADTTTAVNTDPTVGHNPSIAIGTDGLAIIAHSHTGALELRISHCSNVTCTAATNSNLTSTTGVGLEPSITIGLDGLAVIAHRASGVNDLWISHCDDEMCSTATSKVLDTVGVVGNTPSITIGSDNHLIIAHRDGTPNNDLRVTKIIHMSWTVNGWES